jgi:KaiC/GvpD/RAD55 family RecA-like ATPase
LIDGIMPERGLVGIYGPPGIGKSFLALDFAMSVGSGTPWAARAVKKGPVLYIAAEGGTGYSKRAGAWMFDRGVQKTSVAWLLESVPIYGDSDQVDRIMDRVKDEAQIHPKLVVIDTLARCFDGNENEQEDMGRFVAGADRFRDEFDAAVIVVHHTRLDGDRERGNTAFRGAADTMLSIERNNDGLWLKCNKQKDAEEFSKIEIALKKVPMFASCVVETAGTPGASTHDIVLETLKANGSLSFSEWSRACKQQGVSPATFKRRLSELKQSGEIAKENNRYELT